MEYRVLGASGVRVSALCVGASRFGITPLEPGVNSLLKRALDLGINFIDTANSYGNQPRYDRPGVPPWHERKASEEYVGIALKASGVSRYDVVIATKVQEKMGEGPNDGGPTGGGLTRKHIVAQCEQSLRRLQTDHVDVYYAHHVDPTTPLEQTLRAFDQLVQQGKVRYPALSNFPAWQMTQALWLCEKHNLERPVAVEVPYNLFRRQIEREVVPACLELNFGIVTYTSLAMGLLTGTYRPGEAPPPGSRGSFGEAPYSNERQKQTVVRLGELAREWGATTPQIALAWLLGKPGVSSAIIGTESIEQLEELVPAVELKLTADQVAAVEELAA
jgi:1-deoxyxylulose-5-phosphate synthase